MKMTFQRVDPEQYDMAGGTLQVPFQNSTEGVLVEVRHRR
jgi:hypothetical protein